MTFQVETPLEAGNEVEATEAEHLASVIELRDAARAPHAASLQSEIDAAIERIAPLWSLRNFVAVNPFMGFAELGFADGVREIDRVLHGRAAMTADFYHARYEEGRITDRHVLAALDAAPDVLARPDLAGTPRDALLGALLDHEAEASPPARVETATEVVDRKSGSRFAPLAEREIARWCAARFDLGESGWSQPDRDRPLFDAWRTHAAIDPSPELMGVRGFRAYVRDLPHDPRDTISKVLSQLDVPSELRVAVMTRALSSIAGWAGYARRLDHEARLEGRVDDTVVHLLAIRLAFDGAIDRIAPDPLRWQREELAVQAEGASALLDDHERRILWQHAYELGYRHALLDQLTHAPRPGAESARPALQAVFCIDVRSEVLRRHLEAQSPDVRTIGFAGFFGFPIEHVDVAQEAGSARCPVLIPAAVRVQSAGTPADEARLRRDRGRTAWLRSLRKLSVFAYPFVETLGMAFAARLVSDSLGWSQPDARDVDAAFAPQVEPDAELGTGLPLELQIDLAEGALRNMGLVRDFARVVLICGHGSSSTNNPYASGLDCGACGGHRGDVNARVAAAVLQSPEVRAGLAERGIAIPEDTVFVAGLHDTTRDTIELFDEAAIPPALHAQVSSWLGAATDAARRERAPRLGEQPGAALGSRARDWSEVRPEWGLAGNAAFIAAPRDWTRGVDLGGRTFLHDYDVNEDAEGSVLELILTAPLVVASWINLQYYASTTDNATFGSGHKALHNVVGRHGVQLGNVSDLQVGLPWQSVHDGERWVHEPMRLTAIIAAPTDRIDAVLEAHDGLRSLVENGWIHLLAWPDADARPLRRTSEPGVWVEAVPGE